ncbi:MAG TPA: hypothetical protein PLL78_14740 [Fimbriimonadaceae bacterium]|nr:hypothetical protein [Fimbriimonadaceae bacterium]
MAKPTKPRSKQSEAMLRYYKARKAKARKRPGPKPPPPVKIEGDPIKALRHFLNYRPTK